MYFVIHNIENRCAILTLFVYVDYYQNNQFHIVKIDFSKFCFNGTMIFGTLAWTIELYMTKYIIGEIFSSGRATLYKNPSDQTVKVLTFPSMTMKDYLGLERHLFNLNLCYTIDFCMIEIQINGL